MMESGKTGHCLCLCVIVFSTCLSDSKAAPRKTDSILVPSPIPESADDRNSWDTSGSQGISIQDGGLESSYTVNDELALAPLPEGMSSKPAELEASESPTFWPEWLVSNSCCDSCGQMGCDCGSSNHGIFGNLCDRQHGCWVGRFDALILWRNAPQSRPLFTSGGATALDADQAFTESLHQILLRQQQRFSVGCRALRRTAVRRLLLATFNSLQAFAGFNGKKNYKLPPLALAQPRTI